MRAPNPRLGSRGEVEMFLKIFCNLIRSISVKLMYLQMHSDVQVPWFWISCNGTFKLNANEAPERRNAWNVRLEFCKLSLVSRDLKWRLT